MVGKLWGSLKNDFWGTLGAWQNLRPLWLAGGLAALALEIFSVLFFQKYLRLYPCELCVLIRFSMLAIFIGAMAAAINPRQAALKAIGYLVVIWGIARGIIWDIRLEIEVTRPAGEHTVCSMAPPQFPFGLPLDQWLPAHFTPMALCGDSSNLWIFLGQIGRAHV
jgi:disulfide bond formation protein DsbB